LEGRGVRWRVAVGFGEVIVELGGELGLDGGGEAEVEEKESLTCPVKVVE
jgi:hypothetical protein